MAVSPRPFEKFLEIELETVETMDVAASKFYGELGGYAPTIGIIGAVLALIVVMGDLSDPNAVGKGIATAFCATVYALLLCESDFSALGQQAENHRQEEAQFRFMIVEGLVLIASGENPRNLEDQLRSYASVTRGRSGWAERKNPKSMSTTNGGWCLMRISLPFCLPFS